MMLRVVVADDEAVARSRLRRLLGAHADVTVVAEAADGRSAVDVIVTQRPDVVFLDIRMPELDGFEVLAELAAVETPAVVFVTAFSDYAAEAFDVDALDYLLKPYDPARLAETLDRARERRRDGDGGRRLLAAVEEIAREQRALRGVVASGIDTNGVRLRRRTQRPRDVACPSASSSRDAGTASSSRSRTWTTSNPPATTCACTLARRTIGSASG
jgi:DNA-binding LytR/AlgR family response regulator